MAGDSLVHTVVNDFLRQMVGPGGIGVHARPFADRIQTAEDFYRGGVVTGCVH
jgi:hypothetical protein